MGRSLVAFAAILFLAAVASSQSTDHPAFEVAEVHVSPHKLNPSMTGGFVRAGRYEVRSATMGISFPTPMESKPTRSLVDRPASIRTGLTLQRRLRLQPLMRPQS